MKAAITASERGMMLLF
ncbi:MAG: hypothetical protein ACLRHW_01985 [Coprobacillus cateniformis]